jgi:hypothetical protein
LALTTHVAHAHLQRYVTEFDFRYNHRTALGWTDDQHADVVLREIAEKRLTYRRTNATARRIVAATYRHSALGSSKADAWAAALLFSLFATKY